jgi:DNA-directed RNA polymerase specialized sigma24 family protein
MQDELKQLRRAYKEFSTFYLRQRCRWAPANPWRVFRMSTKRLYLPSFGKFMTVWEFLSCVYLTLGVREGQPRGLFQDFDPALYTNGRKSLQKHFLNVFMKRLKARLKRSLRPRTDKGREDPHKKFLARPELGLIRQEARGTRADNFGDVKKSLSDRTCPPKELHKDVETVREALETLPRLYRAVVEMTFWPRKRPSDRKIAAALGIDHKTVRKRRDRAILELRRYYHDDVEIRAA